MDALDALEQRRSEALILRTHCNCFSRMGLALVSVIAAEYLIQIAAVMLIGLIPALDQPIFFWSVSMISTYGVGFTLFYLIICTVPKASPEPSRPLGPARFIKIYLVSVAALYLFSFLTVILLNLLGMLMGRPVENPVEEILDFPIWLNLLQGCVAAPVFEELMFRKLLLDRLRPYGDAFAVLASALAFGLLHGNLSQFFYAFALGCVFGYVVLRTGCVWQTILFHAMINFISIGIIPLLAPYGERGDTIFSFCILGAVLLGIAFFLTLRRKIHFFPGHYQFQRGQAWRLLFGSPGFLLFSLICAVQAVVVLVLL